MITNLEYQEYILKAKNKTFIPSLEWCQNNCTLPQAAELWYYYGKEAFSSYLESYKKTPTKSWEYFLSPEELEIKKQSKEQIKKQKYKEARRQGGLASQSPKLKAQLLCPITFEHKNGISITVFNCMSAKEIASELNKISFINYRNLSGMLVGTNLTTKGWRISKVHTK